MRRIVALALALIVMPYVLYQSRRPGRFLGRVFLWAMNVTHSHLTDWGLQHVEIGKRSTILDIGCGGGRTVQKMAAIATEGRVSGVDYSPGSVAAARGKNARPIDEGRVEIRQASVSHLPFPDDQFDLVTAIETHYYWPELATDLREVLRVLKPGGTLAIIAESYKGGRFDLLQRPVMWFLKSHHLTVDEHRRAFEAAGFSDVHVFEEPRKGWMCGTATKPLPRS